MQVNLLKHIGTQKKKNLKKQFSWKMTKWRVKIIPFVMYVEKQIKN